MARPPDEDHSDTFLIIFIVVIVLAALFGGVATTRTSDRSPTDDFTGLCNQPSPQLGC